jgi:vacuolar-type H+-ATPase subunit H
VAEVEASGSGGGGLSDNLQKALDDLRSAGEKATGDVRARIDDAVQRLNDASSQATSRAQDATSRAQDQVTGWRETLDKATEDVRIQLAKLAIKAQTTPEALDQIESEISARRGELG